MNNTEKKQPPEARIKGLGVLAFEGLQQLILSNFVVPAVKKHGNIRHTVLITSPQLAPFAGLFNYDRVIAVKPTHLNRFGVKVFLKIYFWVLNINGFLSLDENLKSNQLAEEVFPEIKLLPPSESLLTRYQLLLSRFSVNAQSLNQKIYINAENYQRAQRKILALGIKLKTYLVYSNQISFLDEKHFENKKWPYFKDAVKYSLQNSAYPIVLLIDSKDKYSLTDLERDFPNRLFIFESKSLEDVVVLLDQCKAFVGVEGDVALIAEQLGGPTLVLYGPGRADHYRPRELQQQFLNAHVPCSPCLTHDGGYRWECMDNVCMKSISPKEVFNKLTQLLQAKIINI